MFSKCEMKYVYNCLSITSTYSRVKGSCTGGVTSSVVAVVVMTVVTTYLLCRQTAALGYTEVLAHLSVHSTHCWLSSKPPLHSLFWGYPHLRLPRPKRARITGRLVHWPTRYQTNWPLRPTDWKQRLMFGSLMTNMGLVVHPCITPAILHLAGETNPTPILWLWFVRFGSKNFSQSGTTWSKPSLVTPQTQMYLCVLSTWYCLD